MDRRGFLRTCGAAIAAIAAPIRGITVSSSEEVRQVAEPEFFSLAITICDREVAVSRNPVYLRDRIWEAVSDLYWEVKRRGLQPWIITVEAYCLESIRANTYRVMIDASEMARRKQVSRRHWGESELKDMHRWPDDVLRDWYRAISKAKVA